MTIISSLQGAITADRSTATGVRVIIPAADAAAMAEVLRRGMHVNIGQPDYLYGQIDDLIHHLETLASRVSGHTDAGSPQPL